ncbi:hypothetical protein JCM10207_009232 [Rhodosporidiobolus poonsookiae]
MSTPPFPALEPTASLPLAWQLHSSRVVLIGGGAVAASRLYHLLCAGTSEIVVIAPEEGTCEETRYRIEQAVRGETPLFTRRVRGATAEQQPEGAEQEKQKKTTEEKGEGAAPPKRRRRGAAPAPTESYRTSLVYHPRAYAGETDLAGADLILTAIDSPSVSSAIYTAARALRIPVNVADVPPECDFYFGSTLRRGALSVMVSTSGKGPRVAARIRRRLEKALPEDVGGAIDRVGELRAGLRARENGTDKDVIERRMEWMIRVSDRWSLAQLGAMDARMMQAVLDGWEEGEARGYWDVNRSSYCGLGALVALGSRWGLGRCPVDRDPDGDVRRCPFVAGMGGFVLGAASAVVVMAAWSRRS